MIIKYDAIMKFADYFLRDFVYKYKKFLGIKSPKPSQQPAKKQIKMTKYVDDMGWYTDSAITTLLHHYLSSYKNVKIIPPLDVNSYAKSSQTIEEILNQLNFK